MPGCTKLRKRVRTANCLEFQSLRFGSEISGRLTFRRYFERFEPITTDSANAWYFANAKENLAEQRSKVPACPVGQY